MVEPCDYRVNILIVSATFGELLKKTLKFREFFGIEMNTVEIYSLMLFNQFDGIFPCYA